MRYNQENTKVTIEYRCCKCKAKTNPPAPYKMYVLCACGYMTSATAAAVRFSDAVVEDSSAPALDPRSLAGLEAEIERLKEHIRVLESRENGCTRQE